ncbi:MAG: cytochrome c oxidase subunit II [Sphingomonadales bacterium 32-68-7]|nr:MAG: cytochrome c oxidase subunit II [Sphingomonadales bacterium 12-68-11]OYX07562.1 MAG: cytochrome c oxidase subunit II [Sphingomonadales bacterium 32-68-7]
MNFGEIARTRLQALFPLFAAVAVFALPQAALAAAPAPVTASAEAPAADAAAVNAADPALAPAAAAEGSTAAPAADTGGYTPLGPEWIKGQPTPGALGFQEQYSADGRYAEWMHNAVLLPVITVISLFVLGLLLWVVARYNRRANPTPSKTSHNTLIEVVWTVVPALVLVAIAFPSMILLSRQYQTPPENAVTVKVTGYQWYWGYTYPDNGGFEVISNMLPEEEAVRRGEPSHLAADNRMVVPVGVPLRIQTTGADVIHSFAVPSLWFKIDAVPGRLNERLLTITEPGIYYGQCSELCGARHGYMPIALEAVPQAQYEAWVRSKGGTVGGDAAPAAPAAAPLQEPESSVEGAPGAGAAPTGAASAAPAA